MRALRAARQAGLLDPAALLPLTFAVGRHGARPAALADYAARRFDDRIAIRDATGEIRYDDFGLRIEDARIALSAAGVGAGDRIAVIAHPDIASVVSVLAALGRGAQVWVVPADVGVAALAELTESERWSVIVGPLDTLPRPATFALDETTAGLRTGLAKRRGPGGGGLAVVSSRADGSRSAALRRGSAHDSSAPFAAIMLDVGLRPGDHVTMLGELADGVGLSALFAVLATGGTLTIGGEVPGDTTTLVGCPAALTAALAGAVDGLQSVIAGPEPVTPELVAVVSAHAGVALYGTFGTPSTGFTVLATPAMLASHPSTLGREIRGVRVRITDAGAPVTDGEPGTLEVASRSAVGGDWTDAGVRVRRGADGLLFPTD